MKTHTLNTRTSRTTLAEIATACLLLILLAGSNGSAAGAVRAGTWDSTPIPATATAGILPAQPTLTASPTASPTATMTAPPTQTPTATLPAPSLTPEITATAAVTATTQAPPTSTATPVVLPESIEITVTLPMTLYFPIIRTPAELFLPMVRVPPPPPPPPPPLELTTRFLCSAGGSVYIPDNDPSGASQTLTYTDPLYIASLDVYVNTVHTFPGDLSAELTHVDSGTTVSLFNRPGSAGGGFGCSQNDIIAIFDDQASLSTASKCGGPEPSIYAIIPGIGGVFLPDEPLSAFQEVPLAGDWTITLVDHSAGNTGYLGEWCMEMTLANIPYTPPPPPVVTDLPESAHVGGMWGEDQHLPLDCESRSAVDLARHWGYEINEFEFFYGLPQTLNPDTGFVGNVYGGWGQTPPNPYGVHAEPIADRLNDFGMDATAVRSFSWDELRYEIAQNRPAEVWVIGAVASGWPEYYLPPDGQLTVVAPYEHSVIITGYDEYFVWVLNGDTEYRYSIQQFLDSWGVLRNMAVLGP